MILARDNTAYIVGRYGPVLTDVPRLLHVLADAEAQRFLAGPIGGPPPSGIILEDLDWAREQVRHALFYHGLLEFSIYAGFVTEPPAHGLDQELLASVHYRSFASVKLQNDLPQRLRRHLGGHWSERRAPTPFTLPEYYRVLTVVGETFFSSDLAAVARLGSPAGDNSERRAYFLDLLRNPEALSRAFGPGGLAEDADLVLIALRTMRHLDAVIRFIGEIRGRDADAAGQLASLYVLLVGPLNQSVDQFLAEAADALHAAEATLRTSPLTSTQHPLRRDFTGAAVGAITAEQKLLNAIFGQFAPDVSTTKRPWPLEGAAEGETQA